MKSRSGVLLLFACIVTCGAAWGQALTNGDALKERMRREDYYLRIDRKLERDLKATRIKVVPINPETFPLRSVMLSDGREIDFSDGAPSQLLFLVNEGRKDAPSNFEIVPTVIQRQPRAGFDSVLLGRTQGGERVFGTVIRLKDIARLSPPEQQKILEYIADNISMSRDVLEVPIQGTSSQLVFPNHRDFWSYSKANSRFSVPLLEKEKSRRTIVPQEKPGAGRPAADRFGGPGIVRPDLRQSDSVSSNVVLQWPRSTPAATYAVTVAGDTDFTKIRFRQSTLDTTAILPFLDGGTRYYWRVEELSPEEGVQKTLFVKSFTTRNPVDTRAESNGNGRLGYALDFSMSKVTLAHELLYSEQVLGIPGFGVEISLEDPVLSLLTYQNTAIVWGGRMLLNATGDKRDILDKDFLELKLMAKSRFNGRRFFEDLGALKYPFTPLVSSEIPTLNVATPGFAFEIATSKWWNLPYLNFSLSSGSAEYDDPINAHGPAGKRYAFWSTTQWRGSMSFYFNLDSEPEFYSAEATRKRLNIVRLDIGAGTYNVARVDYDTLGKIAQISGAIRSSRIQPYIAAEYVHASQVKTGFGGKVVYFDNRLTLTMWLSLFKIGHHELRLEGTNILGPFGRARFEWEAAGGTLMQFRYRLGF